MCFKMFCSTMRHPPPPTPKEEKYSQQFLIKYAWQDIEEDLSLCDLIPTEQTCKVEQERWQKLCFVNNSE